MYEELDQSLIIRKAGKKFILYGVDEEPISRRELSILLKKCMNISIEEIAFMHLAFHEQPEMNEAHFGCQGTFLFVTRYWPQPE